MTFASWFFPVATVALTVACYACYRSNKPLREEAAKKAEAELQQARNEAARVQREAQQAQFSEDLWGTLQYFLDRPDRFQSGNHSHRHGGFKYGVMLRFFETFNRSRHEDVESRLKSLEERCTAQARTIRDLKMQSANVHQALQMGQPVER